MNSELRTLPAIDKIMSLPEIKAVISEWGFSLSKVSAQLSVETFRQRVLAGGNAPTLEEVVSDIKKRVRIIGAPSLKPVINGTGIVLHTNLGRAPLDKSLFEEVKDCLTEYNNIELDLETGTRGERYQHAANLFKFITGAEDVLIVNNNAAALILILNAFSKGKECLVSRGELVEIGGSFRVPDIMEASGAVMKEVGTTNKTKIADYKKAITPNTAVLCKVHPSNFIQKGFTEEVSIAELVKLSKEHQLPLLYDMGSGLIHDYGIAGLKGEPTVKEALAFGVDLVCFSADKLFGSCQAGIIAGKRSYIEALKCHPMLRAFRVCKITMALLEASARAYIDKERLFVQNRVFQTLQRGPESVKIVAEYVSNHLNAKGIESRVVESKGQFGGGARPDQTIESFSVVLTLTKKQRANECAKEVFLALLQANKPLLANVIRGEIHINMLCIEFSQKESVVNIISSTHEALYHRDCRAR